MGGWVGGWVGGMSYLRAVSGKEAMPCTHWSCWAVALYWAKASLVRRAL